MRGGRAFQHARPRWHSLLRLPPSPYTVAPIHPLFYLLDAGLQKIGLPIYASGRSISFAAALGIVALSWYLTLLYTDDRYSAALSALLCASSSLLFVWGTVGQVDVLALFWALAAFYLYSRYAMLGENTLVWAGVCALLAFFTKQTMLACPAAICLHSVFHAPHRDGREVWPRLPGRRRVDRLLARCELSDGRFLADTVFGNINPYCALTSSSRRSASRCWSPGR